MNTRESPVVLVDDQQLLLKRDHAYAAVYEEIRRLRLVPGTMIDETALGQRLGFGRTPIREALQQLASEGLITSYPRRGMVVAPISLADSRQATEARLVWEPNVARLAALTGGPQDWAGLELVLAESPVAIETEEDVDKASLANQRFHRGITAATGNRYVIEVLDRFVRLEARLPFLFFRHGVYQPMNDEHFAILVALRARDADAAARLVRAHIEITQERVEKTRY